MTRLVDFEKDGKGHEPADAGDPEQALDGGGVEQVALDRVLELTDLRLEQLGLRRVQLRLELIQWGEVRDLRDVELLEQTAGA